MVHNLNAGLGVKRARRFVGKDDFGVVHQGTCDGDALHLAAGKLVGLLVHVFAQANALKRLDGAAASLGTLDAGKREG